MQLLKLLLLSLILCLGCNYQDKKSENDSKLMAKFDSLVIENRKLTLQLSKTSLAQENSNISRIDTSVVKNISKYAFVLLRAKITSREFIHEVGVEGTVIRRPYICSDIKSFDLFNEDKRYQFLDDFQANYLKDKIRNSENATEITYRECFVFNSYQEASKEREKYLIAGFNYTRP